ncbi:MAG: hypothetical protein M1821_003108 [Bathelium mastoideum]|nr:MAG: hypothetical protein M1821_003108 [Bathelium mastoideum]
MARYNSQNQISSEARGVQSSPSFHGRQVTPQPSRSGLRSAASLPCSPQPSTTSSLRLRGMVTPPATTPGDYAISPPSTSSSTPSGTGSSRSFPSTPWDESQQRRLERVTSYSVAKEPVNAIPPRRTHSEESSRSEATQPQFHLRHRLKMALKEFFKRDPLDEEHDCQKLEDTHWTD